MQRLYDTNQPARWAALIKPYTLFIGLIYSFFFSSNAFSGELPDLGNSASAILTPAQEYELGYSIMKELQKAQILSQDIYVSEYLRGLGYRLLSTQGQAQSSYLFFVIEDTTVNAFALPGGFVGINTGLILASESESELAGVIAHEVAHVQQKHMARMYEHMGRLRLSTIAGMIVAGLLATQNTQAAQGAMAAALAGNQQALINYTRDHEKEADAMGILSLTKAGFDPMGMPSFFHRMAQETRYYGNHMPEYLLTHPLTESRLIEAQNRASSFPYKQIPDSLQYHLVQARVMNDTFATPKEATDYFAKKLERGNYRSYQGTLYGYVLALIKAGRPIEAKSYIEELIQQSPDQLLYQLAYAEIDMITHHPERALSRLGNTLQNHPNNFPLTFTYCEWLIRYGNPQKAISLLKQQVSYKPTHPILWSLLSNAYAIAKQPIQAHIAQAQYLKLQGDFTGAAIQLRLAKKISTLTVQERKHIDAEIKDIQGKAKKLI